MNLISLFKSKSLYSPHPPKNAGGQKEVYNIEYKQQEI